MRLVSAIAYKWAAAIADRFNQNNSWKRSFYYWIRLFFGTLVKMAIILGIAALLDVFWPTFYCAVTYGIVKVISGGIHYRSFGRSILLSVMLFITMGVVANTFNYIYTPFDDTLTKGPYIYVWISFVFSLLCAIVFVPVKVRHRVKFWNYLRYIYKVLTVAFVSYAMYYTLNIFSLDNLRYILSIWTAIVFELAASIPLVYYSVVKLNQILNYK
ncbi:MAG: accessory regulator [Clostridiales bacterium]|nr:accessory regulator [Clostridiales bacterium]